MSEKIFEIPPEGGGYVCFEAPGVEPLFATSNPREDAITYAKGRIAHCHGAIRVYNAAGEIEESIPFDERNLR